MLPEARSSTGTYSMACPQGSPGTGGPDDFAALTEHLLARLGIWWSPAAYRRLPVMTPWCVRDRSCRYDQGPEAWGAPREDGYLRDDNSIIKKLPLPVIVAAPIVHPYTRVGGHGEDSRHVTSGESYQTEASPARIRGCIRSCQTSSGYRRGYHRSPTGTSRMCRDCYSGQA